jgi:hypothetical protein
VDPNRKKGTTPDSAFARLKCAEIDGFGIVGSRRMVTRHGGRALLGDRLGQSDLRRATVRPLRFSERGRDISGPGLGHAGVAFVQLHLAADLESANRTP